MSETADGLVIEEADGRVQIVRFPSDLLMDPAHVERADSQLRELVEGSEQPRIVIALDTVEQLSSLMLSVLIRLRGDVGRKGGQVSLAAVPERLRGLFDLVKVGDLFETHPTTEEAVASLAGGAS